jgi:D-alanyl-lipoteichoic acid acyltransferase DltB (MBOAT superfamily)
MFKKIVIADSLAPYVNDIFSSPESHGGGTLFMGAVYFSFQLYADFSGYSDIAIGTAKLLGVELMSNFKFPIFTKDVVEVWSKWHISLTTWFRDYVFKSMGGIRVGRSRLVFNIFIVFMVSGLWHGAHWKYVVWGWVHALLFVITLFLRKNIKITSDSRILMNSFNGLKTLLTLCLLCLTFVLFRAGDLSDALFIYSRILFDLIHFKIGLIPEINQYLIFISIITLFDYLFRKDERNLFQFGSIPRRLSYFFMLLGILIYLNNENNFFYFQF